MELHYEIPVNQGATMSVSPKFVSVERDKVMKDVAVVSMDRSPTNMLSGKLLTELILTLDDLERDASYRGVILTSSVANVFCNGLDITEIYQKSFVQFRDFWKALQDMWIRLYCTRLVTIAAINGTAVAGGCLLAISCDVRIMAKGPFSIGLPETFIGLTSTPWIYEMLSRLIGARKAEVCLQLGTEYSVKDAVDVGLINRDVHPKKLMDACRETMKTWLEIPDFARVKTKMMVRDAVAMKLQGNPEGDTQSMYSYLSQDAVQETLGNVLKKFGMLPK